MFVDNYSSLPYQMNKLLCSRSSVANNLLIEVILISETTVIAGISK